MLIKLKVCEKIAILFTKNMIILIASSQIMKTNRKVYILEQIIGYNIQVSLLGIFKPYFKIAFHHLLAHSRPQDNKQAIILGLYFVVWLNNGISA